MYIKYNIILRAYCGKRFFVIQSNLLIRGKRGNMSAKKLTIVLICCLFVVLGTAVCALLDLYPAEIMTATAANEQRPSFVIATADGTHWTLSLNGQNVDGAECEGNFSELNNPNTVARKMYGSIKRCLVNLGFEMPSDKEPIIANYCDLAFELPRISSTVSVFEAEYKSRGIPFEANIRGIVSSPNVSFEYKKKGESVWKTAVADSTAGGYLFGRGVDAGEYDVRVVSTEIINYEANEQNVPIEYRATRYGDTVFVKISKATIVAPTQTETSAVYGKNLAEIANSLDLSEYTGTFAEGRFCVSDTQTDEQIIAATDRNSVCLDVRDGGHTVYFDFVPDSSNYNIVKNIKTQVNVAPRSLYVRIHDAYSLVGEDLSVPTFQVISSLAGDDTLESLGAKIENNADKNVASMAYRTYVVFSNPNYIADCHSYESQFANYGRYFVYAKQIEIATEDGQVFYVFYGDGLVDVEIRVSKVEVENTYGKTLVAAYKFEFLDEDGNVVTPDDGFSVSWKGVADGIKYVAVYGEEDVLDIGVGGVTLSKTNNVLCFFEGEKAVDILTPANIALIAICGVLLCVLIAMCVAYKKQRRFLI